MNFYEILNANQNSLIPVTIRIGLNFGLQYRVTLVAGIIAAIRNKVYLELILSFNSSNRWLLDVSR